MIDRMTAPLITIFTSKAAPLTKRFSLRPDGTIQKDVLASFYKGEAETRPAPTATALQVILSGLEPLQAITTGHPKGASRVSIGTRGKLQPGQVSRSLNDFEFSTGPGWLVWDYDDKTMPPEVAQRVADLGGPLEALFHVWPDARNGAYVVRPSSSDGVTAPGRDPSRSAGLHGFFLIEDVAQSRAALDVLQARAWAAGLAWMALSKSGAQLVRSIFDTAVGSPERLVFEAPPILLPPLTRTPRAAIVHDAAEPLAIPATPLEVAAQAREAEAKARHAIAPQAERVETAFVETRARAEAKKTGKSLKAAIQSIRQMMQGATLADDHLLQLKGGGWVKVGDLLDNPKRNNRLSLPDPIEGLDYGTDNATLLIEPRPGHPDDKPRLVSHAHGLRTIYTFARYQAPTTPPVLPVWEAPDPDRNAALKATTDKIALWGRKTDRMIRARRDVAEGYADIAPLLPDADRRKAQLTIRRAAKEQHGLIYLPTPAWSKTAAAPKWLVSGAQGTGKTAEVVGAVRNGVTRQGLLHFGIGYVTAFYSPDHTKSTEAFDDYSQAKPIDRPSPRPVQIRGMGAARPDGQGTMCAFSSITTRAAARGVDVKGTICPTCPQRDVCPITLLDRELEAAKDAPEGAVLFAVHDHAFVNLPGGIEPDRFIFDERVRDFGHRAFAVPVEEWQRDMREYLEWHGQSAGQTADQLQNLLTLINPLRTATLRALMEAPANALPIIAEMAGTLAKGDETQAQVVARAASALQDFDSDRLAEKLKAEMGAFVLARDAGTRTRGVEARLEAVLDAAEERHVRNMIGVFRAIAAELAQDHGPQLRSVLRATRNGKDSIAAETIDRTSFPESAPVLHIDGTADHDLAKAWFGPDLSRFHYPVERLCSDALYITGHSFSTSSLTGLHYASGEPDGVRGPRAAETRADLRTFFAQYPGGFIAMPKPAVDAFGDLPGHIVGYFGALRGRNMASACQTGIVLGRNLPKPRDLETLARAFAVALDRPFDPLPTPTNPLDIRFPKRIEGLRMRDGKGHGVEVDYHPDPTAQAVLRQIRDAEAAQAIDRVRAHFAPKRFIIAGACIPDVTFDRVADWQDVKKGGSKLHRTVSESRVLPLSPAELFRVFPAVWGSAATIKRDAEYQEIRAFSDADLLRGQTVYRYTIYEMTPQKIAACLVSYTRPLDRAGRGIRATECKAVVFAPAHEARAVLERVMGHTTTFSILEWTAEAERIDLAHHDALMIAADRAAEIAESKETGLPVWANVRALPQRPRPVAQPDSGEPRRVLRIDTGPG